MTLRQLEAESIRKFVEQAGIDGYLSGRVLDYGCGEQPYRSLVQSFGAHYIGYDDPKHPGSVVDEYVGDWSETDPIDTILCTQVVQYVPDVRALLAHFAKFTATLVLTGPTSWPEVEPEDLHRHTQAGIRRLLEEAGFTVISIAPRAYYPGTELSLGYGAIARA